MPNEQDTGGANQYNRTTITRFSPLSSVSFVMFCVSLVYIGLALYRHKVSAPHGGEPSTWMIILLCLVVFFSLLRIYLTFWRLEEDKRLMRLLCPSEQSSTDRFLTVLEVVLRFSAFVLMYSATSNLAQSSIMRLFGREPDFCGEFCGVFVVLVAWDLIAMPRFRKGLSSDSDGDRDDRTLLRAVWKNDIASAVMAIAYWVAMHIWGQSVAQHILLVFVGVLMGAVAWETDLMFHTVLHSPWRAYEYYDDKTLEDNTATLEQARSSEPVVSGS